MEDRFQLRPTPGVLVATVLTLLLLLAACGNGAVETTSTEAPPSDGTSPDEVRSYVVGYSSTPGIADLGTFLTWDALRTRGIDVETRFFSDADVVVQGMARGDIDFATNMAAVAGMNARAQGVPLKIFTGYVGPEFVLAGTSDINAPEDLNGTTTAMHAEGGQTDVFLRALTAKYGLEDVEILTIPNSSARREALAQGLLDTAPLDLADALTLVDQDPDKFHIVLFFGEEFELSNSGTMATEEFLSENSEDVQTIVTTLVETYRRINDDPEWAGEQALRFFGVQYDEQFDLLRDIIRNYAERKLWDPDGGLDPDIAADTVEFNVTYGNLPEDAMDDIEEFYDFQFIDRTLDELGPYGG